MNDVLNGQLSRVGVIRASDWRPGAPARQHTFLVGDLQRPVVHPFFRRRDVEVILCDYAAGDDGEPHWHSRVDELEMVLEGKVGYYEVAADATAWFEPGDLISIPHGACVQRLVPGPARTLAIKLPSSGEKVHCRTCPRTCHHRREPFSALRPCA
jgi:hypothetical protein